MTDAIVTENLARMLAGPGLTMLPGRLRDDALIPHRRQARDVLALLHQLGVYQPREELPVRNPELLTDDADEPPWPPYVTLSARHRGIYAQQAIDPVYFVDPFHRHDLVDRLARMLERHWQAGGP